MHGVAMAAPRDLHSPTRLVPRSLALPGVDRPAWSGGSPWGLVWCCADLPHVPEQLLGTEPGELLVLQGAATLPSASVTADIVWAAREHGISHLFVLAHAGCRLLQHALRDESSARLMSGHVGRLGLFAGHDVDAVSRTVAHHSAGSLRRDLTRHGLVPAIVTAFADARGHVVDVSVDRGPEARAQLS
jgi:hypothetical protein